MSVEHRCRAALSLSQTLCWRLLGMCVVLCGLMRGVPFGLGVLFHPGLGVPGGCNNNDDDDDDDDENDVAQAELTICAEPSSSNLHLSAHLSPTSRVSLSPCHPPSIPAKVFSRSSKSTNLQDPPTSILAHTPNP